jgi:protein phosphatase 1 regulatory subunit 16A
MEHADLVAEMAHVEHLSTQERLHLARRRRLQQLKAWAQREKKWSGQKVSKSNKHIYFSDSVMLLEAAARNDIDEGKLISCQVCHLLGPRLLFLCWLILSFLWIIVSSVGGREGGGHNNMVNTFLV